MYKLSPRQLAFFIKKPFFWRKSEDWQLHSKNGSFDLWRHREKWK